MLKFFRKVAVITGGGSGIGAATARAFGLEGAKVVVGDLDEKSGQETVNQIIAEGGEAIFVKTDVSNEEDINRLFQKVEKEYGHVDILFANAGIGQVKAVGEISLAEWNQVIGINLTGVMLSGKYAVQSMLKNGGGVIINTASVLGLVGGQGTAAYNAAKGGVVLLTRNMALDYAKKGIRVNAVCPGYVDTPLIHKHVASLPEKEGKAMYDGLVSMHPLGRLATAEEVAKAVLFLASDDASFITGHALTVDGGYSVA